ncbi:MAG: putative secondary metabolism biosynthetic enzyme [Bathelium mastoideum]|nr:MAG: putative secondary metabolism biosynthetic enzyme [Bathelium mastoideum]
MPSATPQIPTSQTAIIAVGPGKLAIRHDAPVPALAPDMALVKTAAVAINPVDAKMLDYSAAAGAIHGYDFAGTIMALGKDAPLHLHVGDRVAGVVHGMNSLQPDVGAFAEYVGACADILLKIPDDMRFEDAATLGTGVATVVLALFGDLKVPGSLEGLQQPVNGVPEFVLVCGGSTATGTRAIEMLKLAGLRPIATSSPSNFELCKRFGAEKVFDYKSPSCAADIKAYTRNTLGYVLDCVSQGETTQLGYSAMGRAGGRYCALEPFREAVTSTRPKTVNPSWLMVLSIFGKKVALDGVYGREANPADRELGRKSFAAVQTLLDQGLVNTHPVKVMSGRWEGVVKGVDIIREQAMSGQKLVYALQ